MRFSQIRKYALTIWQSEPRLLTACLAFAVLNLLLFVVMSYFVSPAINDAERSMIGLQSEVRRMGSGGAPMSLPKLYRKAGDDIARVHALIPSREALSDLVLDISRLADKAGFEIESVSYKPEKVEKFALLGYSLSFTVSGRYRQLKKFVHLLEVSPRIVILDSISLAEGQDEEISMQIKLTTYFREGGSE
ncbi:type 4a pilus biogenesis protein PilO [Malonomonas rubra]|uniref:type 4a pilus biogenesis protein PilO n=1 Tax=Malonomonas rubra TaxID=57040 RepID=UPI0026EB952B|nr:type 4a pilus biogenesis protein PilO [Malonomonas rubra]